MINQKKQSNCVDTTTPGSLPTTGKDDATTTSQAKQDPPGKHSLMWSAMQTTARSKSFLTGLLRSSGAKVTGGSLVLLGIAFIPAGVGIALIVGGAALWLVSTVLTVMAKEEDHTILGSIAWSIAMGALGFVIPQLGLGAVVTFTICSVVPLCGDGMSWYLEEQGIAT